MCEHDAELVIQLVKQQAELLVSGDAFHFPCDSVPRGVLGRMPRGGVRRVRTVAIRASWPGARVAPQRVGEDANRSARGADVFHFARRDPVVDRTAADADRFAGLHD
jgi:hypothetical protein